MMLMPFGHSWHCQSLKCPEAAFDTFHFSFESSHGFAGSREVPLLGQGLQPSSDFSRLEG